MSVPNFKLSMKKARENLGECIDGAINPMRLRRTKTVLARWTLFGVAVLALLAVINKNEAAIGFSGAWLMMYFVLLSQIKKNYKDHVKHRLFDVVSDPELGGQNEVKKSKTKRKSVNFGWNQIRAMAYLKKHGSSQGMYNVISAWKNSNTVNVSLNRLVERGWISKNSDYTYDGWKFIIEDDNKDARKVENIMNEAWVELMDDLGKWL